MTSATLISVWIMAPSTWPVSTETRAIAMVRNRAMMPSVMSMLTAIAVAVAPVADGDQQDPGHDVVDVVAAAAEPPSPAPIVPPNTPTNSSRNRTGIAERA